MAGPLTLSLTNFGEGEDLRDGDFGNDQSRLLEQINFRTTAAKRLVRRPPLIRSPGFGVNTHGLVQRNGQLLTFARRGEVVGVGFPAEVDGLLLFDRPQEAVSETLQEVDALGDIIVALFRHVTIAGLSFYRLHVFDDAAGKLTYTTDPEFPWWHVYSADLPRAVMAVAANKVMLSMPDGNTGYSGVLAPRKWNRLTLEDLLSSGYEFHYFYDGAIESGVSISVPVVFIGGLSDPSRTDGAGLFPMWRLQELNDTNAHDEYFFQREDSWGTNEVKGADHTPSVDSVFAQNTLFTVTVAAGTGQTSLVTFRARPGRWYRFTWLPPNVVTSERRDFVKSGIYEFLNGAIVPETYQLVVVTVAARLHYDLSDRFIFHATPAISFTVSRNGVLLASPANYTIVNVNGNKCKLVMVAASIVGDALEIRQNLFSSTHIIVPPGVVQVDGQEHPFQGQALTGLVFSSTNVLYLNTDRIVRGEAAPAIHSINGFNGLDFFKSVPLVHIFYTAFPANFIITPLYKLGYTANAAQESAYQDAQDFAGQTATESDSGILPTSARDSSGGLPGILVGIRNRLFVAYRGSSQLWKVDENGDLDEHLDSNPLGFGDQLTGHGVELGRGSIVIPMSSGYWDFSASGQLTDNLDDNFIGDRIERLGFSQVHTAVYWPGLSQYVAAETVNGEFRLRILDYHPQSKVAAWARYECDGLTSVDYRSWVPLGKMLYLRSGTDLYWFDGSATSSFRDTNDGAAPATPYVCRAVFRYNDFKKPGVSKRIIAMDATLINSATFSWRTNGHDPSQEQQGPTIDGTTWSKLKHGLSMTTDQLGTIVESDDDRGLELQSIDFRFIYLAR